MYIHCLFFVCFPLSICSSVYCDYFLHGLYTMFVGDARPSHSSDEWVYHDLDILKEVVLPAVRIALKLHQVNLIMHVTTHLHMCIFINCVYEFCDLASDFTKFGIKPIIVCCILGSRILQFILLPPIYRI